MDTFTQDFRREMYLGRNQQPLRATKSAIAAALGISVRTLARRLRQREIRLVEPALPYARWITVDSRTLPAEAVQKLRESVEVQG